MVIYSFRFVRLQTIGLLWIESTLVSVIVCLPYELVYVCSCVSLEFETNGLIRMIPTGAGFYTSSNKY